ncbi:MAG: NUDIX hydrolase [Clostridia bacterium]
MQKIAVIALIKKRDKYLIVNHFNRGWDLPGGYVFEKEDILTSLNREILEETGYKVDNIKLKAIYSNLQEEVIKGSSVTKTIFGFLVEYCSGSFKYNDEVSDCRFIKKENASKYITDKLQLIRFNDIAKDESEIIYVAYNKNPYYEVVRQIIS